MATVDFELVIANSEQFIGQKWGLRGYLYAPEKEGRALLFPSWELAAAYWRYDFLTNWGFLTNVEWNLPVIGVDVSDLGANISRLLGEEPRYGGTPVLLRQAIVEGTVQFGRTDEEVLYLSDVTLVHLAAYRERRIADSHGELIFDCVKRNFVDAAGREVVRSVAPYAEVRHLR